MFLIRVIMKWKSDIFLLGHSAVERWPFREDFAFLTKRILSSFSK